MDRARPLEDLLGEALTKPKGRQREGWIAMTCREDAQLELELRRLLAAHESAGLFMARPASGDRSDAGGPYQRR
jgi:hypothetical protein